MKCKSKLDRNIDNAKERSYGCHERNIGASNELSAEITHSRQCKWTDEKNASNKIYAFNKNEIKRKIKVVAVKLLHIN